MGTEIAKNFIENFIDEDFKSNRYGQRFVTRFPPEPNGYLHIGHAKSICLNFGLAQKYGGITNLRFDDTNPTKETVEYVDNIMNDVKWLGFDWGDRLYFTSDYFDILYNYAIKLIKLGKAYVDDLSKEEIKEYRGTFNTLMAKKSCVPKSIWQAPISTCVILSFIVFSMHLTTVQATNGAFILCMILPILFPMR